MPHHEPEAAAGSGGIVRTAVPDDAPSVGRVQAASWREAYAGLLPAEVLAILLEPGELAQAWRRSLERPPSPRHRLFVACSGADVVGFAAVGPCCDPDADERVGELLVIGVQPSARRAGHGSRLLQAVADLARVDGAHTLAAWVPRDHEPTRAFLQGAGLVPDSAWRDRGVDGAGRTLREVRLVASLADRGPTARTVADSEG